MISLSSMLQHRARTKNWFGKTIFKTSGNSREHFEKTLCSNVPFPGSWISLPSSRMLRLKNTFWLRVEKPESKDPLAEFRVSFSYQLFWSTHYFSFYIHTTQSYGKIQLILNAPLVGITSAHQHSYYISLLCRIFERLVFINWNASTSLAWHSRPSLN